MCLYIDSRLILNIYLLMEDKALQSKSTTIYEQLKTSDVSQCMFWMAARALLFGHLRVAILFWVS